MKNLIVGTLVGIALTVLPIIALAPPQIEVFENGSYTLSSDIPFSKEWSD